VIDTVLELRTHVSVVALMGNHEAMFLDFLEEPQSARAGAFIYNGGSATLASYADDHGRVRVPSEHLDFLYSLRLCHESEHNFFVHAGEPDVPIEQLDPREHGQSMLWLRRSFLASEFPWSKVVVHGHTPVRKVTVRPNRINIDTGCVFRRRLTAVALPGERIISVPRQTTARRVYLRDPASSRAAIRFKGRVPVRVRCDDAWLAFETLDYSELGMYMRPADDAARAARPFDPGTRIEGIVGPEMHSQVAFVGAIVRRRRDDAGLHYGVKILSSRSAGERD